MLFFFPLAKGHRLLTIPTFSLFMLSLLWTFLVQIQDWGIIIITFVIFIFFLQFFRDPTRIPDSADSTLVVSPADGYLFEIDTTSDPASIIFRIRMRFWDVHVNRMPIAGTLQSIEKISGSYFPILPGLNRVSKQLNARKILTFKTQEELEFKVIQISGTLAYRTVPYGQPQTIYERGDRIGIIRMGSETDLHLPANHTQIIIKVGTKIKAGQTIMAKIVP